MFLLTGSSYTLGLLYPVDGPYQGFRLSPNPLLCRTEEGRGTEGWTVLVEGSRLVLVFGFQFVRTFYVEGVPLRLKNVFGGSLYVIPVPFHLRSRIPIVRLPVLYSITGLVLCRLFSSLGTLTIPHS